MSSAICAFLLLANPPVPAATINNESGPWRQIVLVEDVEFDDANEKRSSGPASAGESSRALSVDAVVTEVLARNPSLEEMAATAEAAKNRYPQVVSLEDPMAGVTIGPASIGSRSVDFAYRIEASQKLPYPGKLALRGDAAAAEASAAGLDVENLRIELVQSAKSAYYDYFLVERGLEVNAESVRLLTEFQQNAETQYRTGVASQQDVLQAAVELARQRERELQLRRIRQVATARLNTLMHRPVDAPLGPPAASLPLVGDMPDVAVLRQCAASRRPDLQALLSRLAADQAALALARKEFAPDFEVMAAYDAFWQPEERDLRTMVGVRVNLPVRKERRNAAVREAQANRECSVHDRFWPFARQRSLVIPLVPGLAFECAAHPHCGHVAL